MNKQKTTIFLIALFLFSGVTGTLSTFTTCTKVCTDDYSKCMKRTGPGIMDMIKANPGISVSVSLEHWGRWWNHG